MTFPSPEEVISALGASTGAPALDVLLERFNITVQDFRKHPGGLKTMRLWDGQGATLGLAIALEQSPDQASAEDWFLTDVGLWSGFESMPRYGGCLPFDLSFSMDRPTVRACLSDAGLGAPRVTGFNGEVDCWSVKRPIAPPVSLSVDYYRPNEDYGPRAGNGPEGSIRCIGWWADCG